MSTREERVGRIRSALSDFLEHRHDDFVRALAVALLARGGQPRIGETDVRRAEAEAEGMLGRFGVVIQDLARPRIEDDDLYAELEFSCEGGPARLLFGFDVDEGTWDLYPNSGDTPSRKRAQDAVRKFRKAR